MRSRIVYLLMLSGILFTSCSEDNGSATDMFGTNGTIKNTIAPSTPGNYDKWILGNIGQYGYLETATPNNFNSWNFYIVCSGGNIQRNGSINHWTGEVSSEVITMDADVDNDWNNWTYKSVTYNKTFYIRTERGGDMNEWNISNQGGPLFKIKTTKSTGWNKWEIIGTVPESHQENLVGLFFIPVIYATTQPVIH